MPASMVFRKSNIPSPLTPLHLISGVTANFVLNIIEQSFIEGFPARMALLEVLGTSSRLGPHSNIILLSLTHGGTATHLTVSKYPWGHLDTCPWGQSLSLQCPRCGCVRVQWRRISKPPNSSGTYEFQYTKSCGSVAVPSRRRQLQS